MRMVPVIVVLAAIAVSLVHIRRQQVSYAHEIQRLRNEQVALRRDLWDQQSRLGYLTSPKRIAGDVEALSPPEEAPSDPAAGRQGQAGKGRATR